MHKLPLLMLIALLGSFSPLASSAQGAPADDVLAAVKEQLAGEEGPFTMIVDIKVKPGQARKLERAFRPVVNKTRKEAGNVHYELNKSLSDEHSYTVFETWMSIDALDEHLHTDYLERLLTTLGEIAEEPPAVRVLKPVVQPKGLARKKKASQP